MAIHEEWAAVPGWDGYYEVSTAGRVRSIDRVVQTARGPRRYRSRVLRFNLTYDRHYVDLRRPGYREHARVSRLVALCFVPGYQPGLEACHRDGNPLNDAWTNLRWGTHQSNMRDKVEHRTDHYGSRLACSRNHLYTPDTTYVTINSSGGPKRVCRTCRNQRERDKRRTNGEETE